MSGAQKITLKKTYPSIRSLEQPLCNGGTLDLKKPQRNSITFPKEKERITRKKEKKREKENRKKKTHKQTGRNYSEAK